LIALSMTFAANASADNLRCMPQTLEKATARLENALEKGVAAWDGDEVVQLGRDLKIGEVAIRDLHKNAYGVDFKVNFIDGHVAGFKLRTSIDEVNYQDCTSADASEGTAQAPLFRVIRSLR
jgi:hypothetical protein